MSSNNIKHLNVKDHLVSGESFDLIHNEVWEGLETFPRPEESNLQKYYASPEYISHTDSKHDLFSWIYQLVKKRSIRNKINLALGLNGRVGTLLDIGSGTGDFLKKARLQGWETFGVEPNSQAVGIASEKGIQSYSNLKELGDKQFDVVTLWHVLEHIPNIEESILQISKLVKNNGHLIIAVPNFKSYDAEYYGKYWAAFDVPRHLWHFSKKSLPILFSDNFRIQKIIPMYFDSFYVSLLSEKYKTGNPFSIKGIWIGLLSNLKAFKTKEYSSHIYCFNKVKDEFKAL